MFEFKREYTPDEKEMMIGLIVSFIAENKISYEDAMVAAEEKLKGKMSEVAMEDLMEHFAVDHTNYYVVAEKVAVIIQQRNGSKDKEAFEVLLSEYGVDRYDLPEQFVKEHLNKVEFAIV